MTELEYTVRMQTLDEAYRKISAMRGMKNAAHEILKMATLTDLSYGQRDKPKKCLPTEF